MRRGFPQPDSFLEARKTAKPGKGPAELSLGGPFPHLCGLLRYNRLRMLWSKLFIPTLREAPAGIATEGGRLLTRAGYLRGEAHLFPGQRSRDRIGRIARQEFDSLGAQEFYSAKSPMALLAQELRSYRQLPQVWYQLQERLEACSFGVTPVDLLEAIRRIVRRIVRRCGIEYLEAEWFDGRAFMIPSATGEFLLARAGSYLATLTCALSTPKPPEVPDPDGDFAPEPFHTPHRRTIVELAEFTGLPETSHIKSVVMAHDETLFLVLLRGDHQLSQDKLEGVVRIDGLVPAGLAQIRAAFGASAGSLGPVGVTGIRILTDEALRGRRNMIAGANRDDYHLRHVTPGEDFDAEFFDLRQAEEGDTHNGEPLRFEKAVWVGSVGPAAYAVDLHVTDESGKEVPISVSACNLSIDRILWAAAEQHHDADGLILPPEIAPFDVIVTPVDYSTDAQRRASEDIAAAASKAGLEALIDDRAERPGVKFKDADLIGIPWRVTIGKKLEQGIVEVVERRSK